MGPVLLLLLLAAENSAAPPESTGLNFLVAFPENIAYYHPVLPQNMVQVTALYDDTQVDIKYYTGSSYADSPTVSSTGSPTASSTMDLSEGESQNYTLRGTMETRQTYDIKGFSDKVVHIESNKPITVHAINLKLSSMQTALVLPTNQLATEYLIPPVPKILGTTFPADNATSEVTERAPFRLLIVNGENEQNSVTVKGTEEKTFSLESNQMKRIWLKEVNNIRSVTASLPVAVLFGHPCAVQGVCTCGQLYAALPPAKEETQKFYIPPALAEGWVLVSEEAGTRIEDFDPDSPLVETASTALFYRPGLLLPLIPETDFAACYVVHSIHDTNNSVYVVVHKDFRDGLHVGSRLVAYDTWQDLKGTDYVSTTVDLESGKSVVWHASSKMGVYFMGRNNSSWFGNPAAIISTSPDFRGCVLSPEVVKIGEVAVGWRESVKYCRDQQLELVSFPEAQHQRQIYREILRAQNDSLHELWIGMRRSSQSGEWYWLNKAPVNDTDWEDGEPGSVNEGQCAAVRLDKNEVFGWSDKDCCEPAHPVCYGKASYWETGS